MNHSAETLRRYLRNFDPINESMFRQRNQFSEQSCDEVNSGQPENEAELPNIGKVTHMTEKSSLEDEPDEKLKELLRREEDLQQENLDQKNKIHTLAEHISALEFENEQMSNALRKNTKAYKSLKSSRGDVSKSRSNSNVKVNRGGACERCQHVTDEFGKVVEIINGFIGQFAQLFLRDGESKTMCDNFRRLLLVKHSTARFGESKDGQQSGGFAQLSEWLLVLFEQIDFQSQLCTGFREKMQSLAAENDALAANLSSLQEQRQRLQKQLESIVEVESEQLASGQEERQDKLLELVRLIVQDIEMRHRLGEYISLNYKIEQSKRSLQKMILNLQNFHLNFHTNDRQFANEVRFKQTLIERTRDEIQRISDSLNRLHKSISSSVAVRQKENTLKSVLQNRQHQKASQSQSIKTTANTQQTDRTSNRLYDQIVKQQYGSDFKQSELSRQSSLHHLRRKIQQADSASRMLSNKLSVKLL